ncbi:uncharacterized protein C2845_PM03G22740 [Panicum miliaceum]|uniref:F-box domain-containing protein n=1 Tax=Panicum miliaceum TaxID=4540 RepID=A0A3L6TGZ6_PANMI|nr:uncharacterized protein C2845_PM03G22740 [Panicum miliaceum]
MALSKPLAASEGRAMPALAASNAGVLPVDAVYEILLRVPAKDLCRFRAPSAGRGGPSSPTRTSSPRTRPITLGH